jgi:hypothetical protein
LRLGNNRNIGHGIDHHNNSVNYNNRHNINHGFNPNEHDHNRGSWDHYNFHRKMVG